MATLNADLTATTATDLTTDLSLSASTTYQFQAKGGDVELCEASAAPTIGTTPSMTVHRDADTWQSFTTHATENLYAWGRYGKASIRVV